MGEAKREREGKEVKERNRGKEERAEGLREGDKKKGEQQSEYEHE